MATPLRIDSDDYAQKKIWYQERYSVVESGILMHGPERVIFGDRTARRCRYCKKAYPDTTFRKVAHLFPELLGNKTLVDAWECDVCNVHFAKLLEDDLGKWSAPFRTMCRIYGKSGPPTYRSADGGLRIESKNRGHLHITEMRRLGIAVDLDTENNTAHFNIARQPYVPRAVYKSFVKMALGLMPLVDIERCDIYRQWILSKDHSFCPFRPNILFSQFLPGPVPNDQLPFALFRRNAGVRDAPDYVLSIQMANMVWQLGLPLPVTGLTGEHQTLTFERLPHPAQDAAWTNECKRSGRLVGVPNSLAPFPSLF